MAFFLWRNPYIHRVWMPYAGWLLFALPAFQYEVFRLKAIKTTYTEEIAWWVGATTYFISGLSKLLESHWRSGTGLTDLYGFPHKTPVYFYLTQVPEVLIFLNYAVIFLEMGFLLLSFFKGLRFYIWVLMAIMHVSIFFIFKMKDISLFMCLFHLFLFKIEWIKRLKREGKVAKFSL